ncbi:MAG: carboxypeptidase-like regulatory domain-containing protein, partial [Gemmatimonadetes bacterium]|nr:carboxypeptidase-like regulatory domain-containing protein [Gemmatimonadota bacterium]NIU32109.1 carboxypeptidase-like regulatory domain-containing protein [Gemmatimonadota bacterium]
MVRLPRRDALLRNFALELTEPAQLRGRVVEYDSSSPVDGAVVMVEGTDRSAVTDTSGAFAMPGVPPGRHVLVTERLGFQTRRDTLTIRGGERIALEIHLPTEAIPLDPLVVEARSREREMPWTVGTRVDGLTTEEIDAMLPRIHSTGDLLANANVPGLSVQPRTFKEGNTYRQGWCVELSRSRRLHRDACAMAEVYVDGVRMNAAEFTLGMIDHQAIRLVQFLSPIEAGA